MSAESRYLFVYGTLRRDSPHPMAAFLASHARFEVNATMPGRLYNLGPFPGMTPALEPGELVQGHVFEMNHPAMLLARLDEYEACPQGLPAPPEFERDLRPALTEDGRQLLVWVYRYVGPLDGAQRILNGQYIS
jgi:gamma-glutamylcyclotransferase (GGCT)/AIG2-like uncharacterized protein YtfP